MKKMKKILIALMILLALLTMFGCKTKTLHCDHCGKEVTVEESSNMEEDWVIYCKECNEKLFADDPLLGAK